jgi:hypothetical protein
MRNTLIICIAVLIMALSANAQDDDFCKIPVDLEQLAAKAVEVVDVNMPASMLQFAGNFLNKNNPDEVEAKELIRNLKGICVRSFEFDSEGQYTDEDVRALRSQLSPPVWSSIVNVRSKRDKENVDVYFRSENGTITGLAVIAAEPKELTFVHIDGVINPEQLAKLGGQFGIPKVEVDPESNPSE